MNQKKKKKKTHVPFRLNMLFFAVFLLFSLLILRLGVVQIVYGDDFKREIERTEDITVNNPVPRGKMYDRNGKVIVDNIPLNAITYTKYQGTKQEEMLEVAERLAKLIKMDVKKVQERDKKDFWIMKHPKRANEKITEKENELFKQEKLTDKDLYKLILSRVTESELNELTKDELEVLAIYREFNSGYALTPQIVKNKNVTPQEYAVVSENLEYLPGVNTTTDWDRYYAFQDTLKSVLGKVTSADEGIPKNQLDYYLARDYSRNDRVGKSYIEMQYEDVLHGQKAKVKNKTDKEGNILESEVISEGQRGKDLVLSIDMELQREVEKIISEQLWDAKKQPGTGLLDRAYVVLMNPNTGEILTMAGKKIIKEEKTGKPKMVDDALGNVTNSFGVGSTVKGATILTGYQNGAIQPNQIMLDTPMKIGDITKKSWKNMGNINDLMALRRSSNVYMFKTVIAMGGGHYEYGQSLWVNPDTFDTMRHSFSQFGLGVRTGIDLPNETIGYKGPDKSKPGFLMDLAIGQYDTYTTMQLAQYVSTIANGGYRLQPQMVKEIREPLMKNDELGPIIQDIQPKILNRIDMKTEWIERVQEGFRQVMQEPLGTGKTYFGGKTYSPAGKTGTAEAFYDGPYRNYDEEPPEVMNLSLISYAPSENPEVAMAVMVPWAFQGDHDHKSNQKIGSRVLDAYFDLKKKRSEAKKNPESSEQQVENMESVQDGQRDARIENEQGQ